MEKSSSFVEKHWKAILIVSAATLVSGGVYLMLRSPKKKRGASSDEMEMEATAAKFETATEVNEKTEEEADVDEPAEEEQIDKSALTEEKRDKLALAAKNRGNKYFQGRMFDKACQLYTKAIEYYEPGNKKCSVFYSNRAACYANLNEHEKVIEDCTAALKSDPLYVKALARRSVSYERLGMLTESLDDMTTACLVEEFKNPSFLASADRVLKALATKKQAEIMKLGNRNETLPSLAFVSAYMKSFRYAYLNDEDLLKKDKSSGDELFIKAVENFRKKNWEAADRLCQEAVEAGCHIYAAKAHNMRGTFLFIKGEGEKSKVEFEKSMELDPTIVNNYIKYAGLFMETGDTEVALKQALDWFSKGLKVNPNDPDLYYHRGQIHFLVQRYDDALKDYDKSIELDPDFLFARIQKAVAVYRLGNPTEAKHLFEEAERKFNHSADLFYYHGEILLDQQRIDEAIECFDKAIKLEPKLPLPYLNKGIIYFHMKGDFNEALRWTQKALEADDKCDMAYMHLGQMYMQAGKLDESIITYKKAVDLARSAIDLENSIMGLEAVRAQSVALARIQQAKRQ